MIMLLGGNVQRVVVVCGEGAHVRAVLQQQHRDVHIAEPRGDVQRRLTLARLRLHSRAVAEQDADYIRLNNTHQFTYNIDTIYCSRYCPREIKNSKRYIAYITHR